MTRRKTRTILWTAAGLALSLAVLLVVLSGLTGQVLVTDAADIPRTADAVMDCIRDGDWKELKSMVAGAPELALYTGEDNTAEALIWNTYCQSLQWSCKDEYELQGGQVIQQVTVSSLDISALTRLLRENLPKTADNTTDDALKAAAEEVLRQDIPMMQKEISMRFIQRDGQWKLVPDSTLLSLLSGFTAG